MRRITFMILGLGLALAPAARAEDWSKTYSLTGKPDLRVETSDANIRVDTWNQNTIEARVTAEGWKIGAGGVKVDHVDPFGTTLDEPHGQSEGVAVGHLAIEVALGVIHSGNRVQTPC